MLVEVEELTVVVELEPVESVETGIAVELLLMVLGVVGGVVLSVLGVEALTVVGDMVLGVEALTADEGIVLGVVTTGVLTVDGTLGTVTVLGVVATVVS